MGRPPTLSRSESLTLSTRSGGKPETMSSLEIAEVVEKRHDTVKLSIERLAASGVITLPPLAEVSNPGPGPKTIEVYNVGERDSYVVVAQLSPEFTARLVDRWQAYEKGEVQPKAMTPAETLLAMMQLQVDAERRQAEQAKQIEDIGEQVALLASTKPLPACPRNAESLHRIQNRFNVSHGLSRETTAFVLQDSPYAPKPACLVQKELENGASSIYQAFYTRQANAAMKRFIAESVQVSGKRWTHPFLDSRFAMKPVGAVPDAGE